MNMVPVAVGLHRRPVAPELPSSRELYRWLWWCAVIQLDYGMAAVQSQREHLLVA